MKKFFRIVADHPKFVLVVLAAAATLGVFAWRSLAVDVFPDISVPRVTIQTEAGGLTAEEVEQLVTIPVETAVNGIPGVSTIRSSSGGGLSFVWVDFDWNADLARARFDVFERLARVREALPEGVSCEIAPVVSVTGEIMLVALTAKEGGATPLELRELAEYDLRTRLLGIPGIGEVAVIGGRLPEYRVSVDPRRLAEHALSVGDVVQAAQDTRTSLSAGYLPDVAGEEVPIRQLSRADSLDALKRAAVPLADGGALRLGDVADLALAGAPRRGSASFNGREAVVLSVQKTPGGNTPALTAALDRALADFARAVAARGVEVHANAYRQADFIGASIRGGGAVVRDAVIVVVLVLLLTLLELRTILVVLCTMPLSILLGVALFPFFGLGVNVMTLGGFAVAAGDIVDAAIIFTEVVRRRLGENAALPPERRRAPGEVIAEAAASVAPGVGFSTLIVALVFLPLMMLTGLEGRFFRPLGLSYLCVFTMSLVAAAVAVPALARLFRLGSRLLGGRKRAEEARAKRAESLGIRAMRAVYRPFLWVALKLPKTVVLAAALLTAGAVWVAKDFGSSFLPPFREDAFNVALSLPPGASLAETERVAEACVSAMASIPGVLSVTRRTGRAERDQHAEPVSSSEYVVRVDLEGDTEAVKAAIRERLGTIPGCSLLVGYPIAHRIGAVLSGTEAEVAVNVFGEDVETLRAVVARMKTALDGMPEVSDVRANREVTVRSLRIDYDADALQEAGLTLREAGEQVAAAFNGVEAGEVRDGLRRRAVVVRLAGCEEGDAEAVRGLLLSGRNGRRVRLDDVARVVPEEASNLMLREGGRRKALISCNAADGVNTGELVEHLRARLEPIASEAGCTVSFGGSYEARESAGRRLAALGAGLVVVIFFILVVALASVRAAFLALVNVPLGLIGAVAAVMLADPVLSVSSLVGFVTVIGFVLRNGLLLLNRYQDRLAEGADLETAIREGSEERMPPIVMTSLTTVFGLVPIIVAGSKPGGELLAPLAVVQFGGLLGATVLNLVVLPAAVKVFGLSPRSKKDKVPPARMAKALCLCAGGLAALVGCRSYEPKPIDWAEEARRGATNEVVFANLDAVAQMALIGNPALNRLRLQKANSERVASETGWWDDPELDFDALRVIKPDGPPFLMGSSLAFTIPLSGVPGCEKKAAAYYVGADAEAVRAAERDVAAEARQAAVRLAALRGRLALLAAYEADARIRRAFDVAEKLCTAGEIAPGDLASARRRRHGRLHALRDLRREVETAEAALVKILGLLPGVALRVPSVELHAAHGLPSRASDPLDLVRHPKVREATARLAGGEAALEAEIRRQYPDLRLGPAYEREEGLDRLGLVAGVTLPLWNRNRKGIAEAEGMRDTARFDAVAVWRDLVRETAAARARLADLLDHPPAPGSDREQAEKLADAGELGPLDYLAVREELCDLDLEEAVWRAEVCGAYEDLARYAVEDER